MQRLFSMFPIGLPGLALLLLRVSVAIAVVAAGYGQSAPGWLQASVIIVAVCLLAGYLTPVAAVVALALQGFFWPGLTVDGVSWSAVVALDAIALALLGPGSYSFDARLFGRRVVVIPPP